MALAVLGGEGDGQRYDPHFTAFLPPTAQPSRCTPHPISHTAPRQFPVTPSLPSPHHLRPPTAVEGSPGWAKHDYPCTHSINAEKKQAHHPAAPSKTDGTIGHAPSSPLMMGKLKGQLCPPNLLSPPTLSVRHHTRCHAPGLLQLGRRGCDEVAARFPLPGFTCGRRDTSLGRGADGRTARPALQPWSNGAGSRFSQGSFPRTSPGAATQLRPERYWKAGAGHGPGAGGCLLLPAGSKSAPRQRVQPGTLSRTGKGRGWDGTR